MKWHIKLSEIALIVECLYREERISRLKGVGLVLLGIMELRTMRVEVTKNVDNHQFNSEYETLRIVWNGDRNFRCRADGSHDWCPTDVELMEVIERLTKVSVTFKEMVLSWAVNL
jgi:hypothetical protein